MSEEMESRTYAEHGTKDYASRTALGCEESGEPVFLLRAQDKHAADVVRYWADRVEPLNPEMAEEANAIASAMEAWAVRKDPD